MSHSQEHIEKARPTPWEWLWSEIAFRYGEQEAKDLYDTYTTASRRYMRLRRGSAVPLDAPAQRPGPRRLAVWKEEG